jgi:two-component system sensor histidine kinase KdpD
MDTGTAPRGLSHRRLASWVVLTVGLPVLTVVLVSWRSTVSLESALLLYLTVVVLVAALGGVVPGLVAAVTADLLANFFFVPPYGTFHIDSRDDVVAIIVFVAVAAVVSVLVELASRSREAAARNQSEVALLARLSDAPVGQVSSAAVLEDIRIAYALTLVQLQRLLPDDQWHTVASAGDLATSEPRHTLGVDPTSRLLIAGPERFAADQHTLRRMAATAVRMQEEQQLAERAEESRRLADLDRTRSALLAAVGHDLRTPLTGVKAGVSSLRQQDVEWSDEETRGLLATIEESADRLAEIVSNLLDATRIQAGAVVVEPQPVALDEVVYAALATFRDAEVDVEIPVSLPLVSADPILLERVLVNLLDNALRYKPPGRRIEVTGCPARDGVELLVVDHGPGIANLDPQRVFDAFQRSDDHTMGGTGLGLAIVKGFCDAMHVPIEPAPTAGGGLTMRMLFQVAR